MKPQATKGSHVRPTVCGDITIPRSFFFRSGHSSWLYRLKLQYYIVSHMHTITQSRISLHTNYELKSE